MYIFKLRVCRRYQTVREIEQNLENIRRLQKLPKSTKNELREQNKNTTNILLVLQCFGSSATF